MFTIRKLRTMVSGNNDHEHQAYVTALIGGAAERHDGVFKLVSDPRITRVGRILRRYSLDELPQLWNVIKGDMSLVGPRPALPYETDEYTASDWFRLKVKPGMTGLSQIAGRAALSFPETVALDVQYWESWTLLLDLSILMRTPWVVATGVGAA